MGHNVTVVCASYTHLRKKNPEIKKDFTEEIIEGVRYLWVKTPKYNDNTVFRSVNIFTFVNKLKKSAKHLANSLKPDLVIASSTYPMDIYPCKMIASESGAKLVFEIHDLWPLTQMTFGNLSHKNLIVKYLQKAEDFAFTQSDDIVSILPNADKHIKERNVKKFRFHFIPNGVIMDKNIQNACVLDSYHQNVIDKLKSQNKFILMYVGGHTVSNSLETLISSCPILPGNVSVVMVGEGRYKKMLMDTCAQKGYKNIHFLPSVPKNQVNTIQSLADCLYIGAKKCKLYEYGVGMNKYYDYMLSKKPILNGVEASNDIVKKVNCGISVKAESNTAICEGLKALIALTPEEREQIGQNGYEYVTKNHDYQILARNFLNSIFTKEDINIK